MGGLGGSQRSYLEGQCLQSEETGSNTDIRGLFQGRLVALRSHTATGTLRGNEGECTLGGGLWVGGASGRFCTLPQGVAIRSGLVFALFNRLPFPFFLL